MCLLKIVFVFVVGKNRFYFFWLLFRKNQQTKLAQGRETETVTEDWVIDISDLLPQLSSATTFN